MYKFLISLLIVFSSSCCTQQTKNQLYSKDELRLYNINSLEEALTIRESSKKPILTLNISDSKDLIIPKSVFEFENLQKLTLNFCSYSVIPKEVEQLHDLQFLHTLMTPIESLSSEICSLSNLKELAVANGELKEIPNNWAVNSQLRFINFQNNQIENLPSTFINLKNLEHLDLSSNQINEFISVRDLSQLKLINLSNNQINKIGEDAFKGLESLSTLNLGANPLKMVPSSVTDLTNLKYLILADTDISNFPEGMDKLKNLKEIDISYCKNLNSEAVEKLRKQLPNTQIIND